MKSTFMISLDFELHWGGFEKWPLRKNGESPATNVTSYNQYFLNTRQVIPGMLEMFDHFGVHVTWATVGMLFHRSKTELLDNTPTLRPSYSEQQLSAYQFIASVGIGADEADDPFHFAPSLIERIVKTPFQEIGTHTYSHYYCNEPGQTASQFCDDLRAAKRIANTYGVKLSSLVFPRNQFNDEYLKICFEEGITSVRSNPLDWFWQIDSTQHESFWKRLNRGADAYFPVGGKNTYPVSAITRRPGFPVSIPASRLLRPYSPREYFLNTIKIDRIKHEITEAAKRNEVYHLWWHPHNFGWHPGPSMSGLEAILSHYKDCASRYGMQSMNMGELADTVSYG